MGDRELIVVAGHYIGCVARERRLHRACSAPGEGQQEAPLPVASVVPLPDCVPRVKVIVLPLIAVFSPVSSGSRWRSPGRNTAR